MDAGEPIISRMQESLTRDARLALDLALTIRHDGHGGVADDLADPAGLATWVRAHSETVPDPAPPPPPGGPPRAPPPGSVPPPSPGRTPPPSPPPRRPPPPYATCARPSVPSSPTPYAPPNPAAPTRPACCPYPKPSHAST